MKCEDALNESLVTCPPLAAERGDQGAHPGPGPLPDLLWSDHRGRPARLLPVPGTSLSKHTGESRPQSYQWLAVAVRSQLLSCGGLGCHKLN